MTCPSDIQCVFLDERHIRYSIRFSFQICNLYITLFFDTIKKTCLPGKRSRRACQVRGDDGLRGLRGLRGHDGGAHRDESGHDCGHAGTLTI